MTKRTNPAALIAADSFTSLAAGAEVHGSIDGSPYTFAATAATLPAPFRSEGPDPTEDSPGCERS